MNGFDWLTGGEWYLLNDTPSNILGKSPTAASNTFGTISRSKLRFSSYAVYAALGKDLTQKLNLSGDIRFTQDNADFLLRQYTMVNGTNPYVGNVPVTTAALNPTASRSQGNVSYTGTLAYKPSD